MSSTLDPALLCRAFFGTVTTGGIAGFLVPALREQILDYGNRSTKASKPATNAPNHKTTSLLEHIAAFQVLHTCFTHFYAFSIAESAFWGYQIVTRGRAFQFLASLSQQSGSTTITANQASLGWILLTFQGTRRLYECITLARPSQAKMWIGLYGLGVAYYAVMGVTVWIEGICEICDPFLES